MSVGEFCNREVVIAQRDAGILELSQLMRTHHVGDIVIVDVSGEGQNIPVGIITDRDIVVELIACQVPFDTVTAGDIMSHELVTAGVRDGMWDALQHMRQKGVRRIIVVNEQGGLEGILTVDDLLELLAEELTSLAKVAFRGMAKEKQSRE